MVADHRPGKQQPGREKGQSKLVDISMAGRIVHSSGIAVRPYRRLSHLSEVICRLGDLETSLDMGTQSWPLAGFFNRRNCGRFIPAPTFYCGRYSEGV